MGVRLPPAFPSISAEGTLELVIGCGEQPISPITHVFCDTCRGGGGSSHYQEQYIIEKRDQADIQEIGSSSKEEIKLSHEKRAPGWLSDIGDEQLPSYIGIIINHYKDPY